MEEQKQELSFLLLKKSDKELLVEFLTSETWKYLAGSKIDPEVLRSDFEKGKYLSSKKSQTFWIINKKIKIGLIRIYDLQDDTPLFDIRILSKYQGKGYGTKSLKWLSDYVFNTFPKVRRIEGQTRSDNEAMRLVFRECGWIKESQHRKAWEDSDSGKYFDSIGYAILKEDWKTGKITPLIWEKE